MIGDHVKFLKSVIENISFDDGKIFSKKTFEVYPAFSSLPALVPCAVIRHQPEPNSVSDESAGYRIPGERFNEIRRSKARRRFSYRVDFWLNADGIEKDYLGLDDAVTVRVDAAFNPFDIIREERTGNPIDVDYQGCAIVDDQDGTAELYKVVLAINFSELVYRSTTVQKFSQEAPVETEISEE